MVLSKLFERAESAVDGMKYQAENIYVSAVSSVEDVVDYTSASFFKAYAGVVGTYHSLKYAGLAIALVTSPVPALIGLAVLWMMELSLESIKGDIDNELKDKGKKREFNRVVKMLRKYGRIPKTAVVETSMVRMEIDAISGSVTGVIRTDVFSNAPLSDFDDEKLRDLVSNSSDEDTKSIIEAYISYREKASRLAA